MGISIFHPFLVCRNQAGYKPRIPQPCRGFTFWLLATACAKPAKPSPPVDVSQGAAFASVRDVKFSCQVSWIFGLKNEGFHGKIIWYMVYIIYIYIYIYIYLGKFNHDLTVLPHWESWLVRELSQYCLDSG